jgi:hypothetical protein
MVTMWPRSLNQWRLREKQIDVDGDGCCRDLSHGPQVPVRTTLG